MISVIIPALNEESTIGQVIARIINTPQLAEVIVVDDKSMDDTVAVARKAGATVITSTKLGKGASMKDGVLTARSEVIVFLDADILTYPDNVVEILAEPILSGEADFVKSYFARQSGRVTELVAKPLLSILQPDFPKFHQPLSGMIAGKKSLFGQCEFEDGYGIDIGILLDMHRLGVRISEVCLGKLENRLQPLEQLGKMSREVARTILKKSNSVTFKNLETYENIQVIRSQMDFAIRESLMTLKKIAVFDMDNTLLRSSFIRTAAMKFGLTDQLQAIVLNSANSFIRTKQIAKLLKGKSIAELLEVADSMEVTANLAETIQVLKQEGYITGIISDSYDCITNHFRNRYGFDFTISNELEFSGSIVTGEVKIPSLFLSDDHGWCKHDYCKLNALQQICDKYQVDLKNTLVIGDGENDLCMIKKAGIGVSFCSTHPPVDLVADFVIKVPDFSLLTPLLN